MAQETNQTQGPMLCATGCGFYGNPRTNGMCSVCYKDHLQRQNSSGRVSPPASSGASSVVEFQSSQRLDHSSTVVAEVPSAIGSLEPRSGVSSQALFTPVASLAHSEDEDSTWEKEGLKTHELQVEAPEGAAVSNLISELEELPLDRDPVSISSESGIQYWKPGQERQARAGGDKRKRSEAPEPVGAPALEDSDWASAVGKGPPTDRPKPRKNRCFLCRKKVGLTGFDCRCGNVFCGIHRYSDIHSCTFDYKADAAEKIRKENPVVVGEKIQKI